MATISKITPGQTLYVVERRRMGNTTIKQGLLYQVKVTNVDPGGAFVMASINGNTVRKYGRESVSKWKVKKPEKKGTVLGLATY